MISSVRFENYRCFKNSTMTFKDLTIIVGRNNAGKSTIIEALRMISSARNKACTTNYINPPNSLAIQGISGFKINCDMLRIDLRTVVYFYKEITAKITAYFDDKSKIIIYLNSDVAFATVYNKSGKLVTSRAQANKCEFSSINILPQIGLIKENEKFIKRDTIIADKDTYLSSRHFRNELLLYESQYKEDFRILAENTWQGLRIRELDYKPTESEYIYFFIEDSQFTSEIGLMGSGIQMWLQIIWFICRSKDCDTVILDEPDVYMHPDLQRKIFKIIKRRFKQVIIATHSVEIISEAEPRSIINIDKSSRQMSYTNSQEGVQHIIDGLGSVHNISLVRIANTKKCLFVEGYDIGILSKLYSKIYPESDYSLDLLPTIILGGWSRLEEAFGASQLFYNETKADIKCICILDRDYYPASLIEKQYQRASECHLTLHIWNKKEIENYLIKPSMLFRLAELPDSEYDMFISKFNSLIDANKTSITDHIAEKLLDKSKGLPKCNEEARCIVNEKWDTLEGKISLIGGKEFISQINVWMKESFNKNCSLRKMIKNLRADEIDDEVKDVLELLTR